MHLFHGHKQSKRQSLNPGRVNVAVFPTIRAAHIQGYDRQRGNMLAMVALVGGIVVVVLLAGFILQMLFLSHQHERTDSDECALSLAHTLNDRDRLGQMNTLVERSRELVYASRTAYQGCAADESDRNLEDLSRLLHEDSRASAQLVELGRQTMTEQVIADLTLCAKVSQKKLKGKTKTSLGWLTISPAKLVRVEYGFTKDVLSNVVTTEAFDDLLRSDKKNGYLDSSGRVFVGNINARLPAPDNDLNFKMCSLASPFGRATSPPRLTANSMFTTKAVLYDGQDNPITRPEQLPSALKVELAAPVSALELRSAPNYLQSASSAAAGGAMPPPDQSEENSSR